VNKGNAGDLGMGGLPLISAGLELLFFCFCAGQATQITYIVGGALRRKIAGPSAMLSHPDAP